MSVATKRFAIGAVAAGMLVLGIAPAIADTQPFTGPGLIAQCSGAPLLATGDPTADGALASVTSPADFGAGSACFKAPQGAIGVSVAVTDGSGTAVPYNVDYQAPDGQTNSATTSDSCAAGTFQFPTDISSVGYIYVFADDPVTAQTSCGSTGALSGTITVTWLFPPVA